MNISSNNLSIVKSMYATNKLSSPLDKTMKSLTNMLSNKTDNISISNEAFELQKSKLNRIENSSIEKVQNEELRDYLNFAETEIGRVKGYMDIADEQVKVLEDSSMPEYEKQNARNILTGVIEITDFTDNIVSKNFVSQIGDHATKEFNAAIQLSSMDSAVSNSLEYISKEHFNKTGSSDNGVYEFSSSVLGIDKLLDMSTEEMKKSIQSARKYLEHQEVVAKSISHSFEELHPKSVDLESVIENKSSQKEVFKQSLSNLFTLQNEQSSIEFLI